MTKEIMHNTAPSEFKGLKGVEYFNFEEDFVEKNMRCIPMIVRLKMDKAGIKLRLDEWSRFNVHERVELATKTCDGDKDVVEYAEYTRALIKEHTGRAATPLAIDSAPAWSDKNKMPSQLLEKLSEEGVQASIVQWQNLTDLQRFALLKLCRPGHENRNFPKALKEFGWL